MKLIPIADLVTNYSRQYIKMLVDSGKVRGSKRTIGNMSMWFISQEDVTAHETKMKKLGSAKHGLRYQEPVA